MRISEKQAATTAAEIIKALVASDFIEAEQPKEAERDIEAVLLQYARDEQQVTQRARDVLAQRNLPPSELGRIKKLVADERKLRVGEEAIDYLLDQLLEMLMHSTHVDEIFGEDHQLRLAMRGPLRKLDGADQELEGEVRAQLKHVKEGSSTWEVEYQRIKEELKRRKGL